MPSNDTAPRSGNVIAAAPWRGPWSLSARLTAWYALASFVLVLATGLVLYGGLRRSLDEEDDVFLAHLVDVLRGLLAQHSEDSAEVRWEVESEWSAPERAQVFIRILDRQGRETLKTPGIDAHLPVGSFPKAVGLDESPRAGSDQFSRAGKHFRTMSAMAVTAPPGRELRTIQLALDETANHRHLAAYRDRLRTVAAVGFVLSLAVGYGIARHGMRPVRRVQEAAARIRSGHLHERVDPRGYPTEVAELAVTFNDMVGRLEESFQRLSRFSADIAHELRTPISNLRGEADVALRYERTPAEYREVLASSLEEYARLAHLIDNLLFLARAEDPKTMIRRERLDLHFELESIGDFYLAAAEEVGVSLRVRVDRDLWASVDRALFQRAVGNLVQNAIRYTGSNGSVLLDATREEGSVLVRVQDTGPGIPPEHLKHLFDRFYRVDVARSKSNGGSGLGLAIAKSISTLHGGTLEIHSVVGEGTRATLVLPWHDDMACDEPREIHDARSQAAST
jgi:two-component system, OmpR family, heavy metal sensor histidine kinase CusS